MVTPMLAQMRRAWGRVSDAFWIVPVGLVSGSFALALGFVYVDRANVIPQGLVDSAWIYSGGGTGARTLLGAVASSTIGVAGTAFSITIAALSLAAGQMGPRLLRNFTRDRGNQVTLGIFLGTFTYALTVLRTVRTQAEGAFTPHLALSVAILLAFVCVGTLIYFVGHMAGRINVDTVVELVSADVRDAIGRLTTEVAEPPVPEPEPAPFVVDDPRRGYVQQLDADGLADWAASHDTSVQLLVRIGDYVFPGAPIARTTRDVPGASAAIFDATALGPERASEADIEFAIRQLVEVAVRALSPGINDPHTAISVLDRLGAALCDVAPTHLRAGTYVRNGRVALRVPEVDYDGLVDSMFHLIRQNATGSTAVLMRIVEVLTAVATCERDPERRASLRRHVELTMADVERSVPNPADVRDVKARREKFDRALLLDQPPRSNAAI